ncbi:hypothetical protein RB653_008417 [Dictyostelium firmibasis]|uniref:EXS domain-containing protein n=1 Tax=Dictyostelium firmibasis TaxID=79012 RepID=A0AAN7TSR7_9MYCE
MEPFNYETEGFKKSDDKDSPLKVCCINQENENKMNINYNNNNNNLNKTYLMKWVIVINLLSPFTIFYLYLLYFDSINSEAVESEDEFNLIIYIYRSMWSLVLLFFLSSLNFYIWDKFNIEYISIFKFKDYFKNPTTTNSIDEEPIIFNILFKKSMVLLSILCISLFVSIFHQSYDKIFSIFIWTCFFISLFYNKFIRSIIIENMVLILKAPFKSITFLSFWIADQITSLSIFLKDFNMSSCFLITFFNVEYCSRQLGWLSIILSILPFLFRINQCLRVFYDNRENKSQLFNALKYFMGLIVLFFSNLYHNKDNEVYKVYWVSFAIVGTIFSTYWDVVKDWGLFSKNSKNYLLRDQLLFSYKPFYYYSIVSNIIMRFTWVILINPSYFGFKSTNEVLIGIFLISIDIVRRCQWNFIRLEFEVIQLGFKNLKQINIVQI